MTAVDEERSPRRSQCRAPASSLPGWSDSDPEGCVRCVRARVRGRACDDGATNRESAARPGRTSHGDLTFRVVARSHLVRHADASCPFRCPHGSWRRTAQRGRRDVELNRGSDERPRPRLGSTPSAKSTFDRTAPGRRFVDTGSPDDREALGLVDHGFLRCLLDALRSLREREAELAFPTDDNPAGCREWLHES